MKRGQKHERREDVATGRLTDEALLDKVQRETIRYFWDFGHPVSGLARDRTGADDECVTIGGSGMGVMAIIAGVARGWIRRDAALERLLAMTAFLMRADSYHGAFPHFMNGTTGRTIRFFGKDDGADLVETGFLIQGLIAARNYFDGKGQEEALRGRIGLIVRAVEWDWFTRGGRDALYWHWSPNNGFAMNHEILGWNECLILFVLGAGSPSYPLAPAVYHNGFAQSRTFINRRLHEDVLLPLGPDGGGPLFFAHYSFLGLDPRGLSDAYADYWQQNVAHVSINYRYCLRNPKNFAGYGPDCWGLTASDEPGGYSAHAPDHDTGVISPTAALSSLPYAPKEAMAALRHFHDDRGDALFGDYGFADAFEPATGWVAKSRLAIDQGPIAVMIENFRSGLLWRLVMADEDVRRGLLRLGIRSAAPTGA